MTFVQIPQNKPLSEQVVELLEAKIIKGDFRIGDRLPTEHELASMYQVSRTVIREAMKALREKGWIDARAGRGTFVVDNVSRGVNSSFGVVMRMNPEDGWEHLIDVREMLEPEIAAMAAVRADANQIAVLQAAAARMDSALAREPSNIEDFLDGDFAFHMTLAESTRNPLVLMIVNPVVKLMRELQKYHLSKVEGGGVRSQHHHRLILDAIIRHDAETARLHMREHIRQVREDVEGQG